MAYKVLLIDDSSIVRKMLLKTLRLSGIDILTVHEANNGQEGLDILNKEWVDVIFLDINMPVMNGMEFMRELRNNDIIKNTPVIVISTEGSKERRDELDLLEVKAFIRKPVSPEILGQTVVDVLGGKNE